jgi:FtsP/CotA-like multicopper oxidase with cupredoxin domain
MAPDGVEKEMYVYNGQFPGPLIEANWGDTLVIHVQNNLQTNGTSIHWHGFLQHMNVANDGVPGVTQCPIPPGASFTYTFRATSYGTTWYHSHFSLQYTNGLTGPIIIHGPSSANWDIDTGVLPIMDWYHEPAFEAYYTEIVAPLAADNALFNGLNTFNDSDTIVGQKFEMNFTPGKKHRIRLVNMSTDSHFKFSIDEHVLTVQAADFVAITPYQTTVLNIFIGQRYDLVVEANQAVGNYWMRLVATAGCSNVVNKDLTAIIRYNGADSSADPTSTAYVPPNEICEDETELVPVVVRNAGPFSYGNSMDISIDQADLTNFGFFRFDINGSSFRIDWSDPTLLLVDNHDPSYPTDYNVLELNGTQTTWVYFVVQSTGLFALNHPIHMHGHDFLLLATGTGVFNTSVLQSANLNNPPRRDVITLPASAFGAPDVGGFAVIAFPLDNPGIWMIHCHIAWHVSEGLALEFVERIDEIPGNVGVTSQWQDNCDAWQSYQTAVNPLEDDSGI